MQSFEVLELIYALPKTELNKTKTSILIYMTNRQGKKTESWSGIRTIAAHLKLNKDTVWRSIKYLRQNGWILLQPKTKNSNSYSINTEKLSTTVQKSVRNIRTTVQKSVRIPQTQVYVEYVHNTQGNSQCIQQQDELIDEHEKRGGSRTKALELLEAYGIDRVKRGLKVRANYQKYVHSEDGFLEKAIVRNWDTNKMYGTQVTVRHSDTPEETRDKHLSQQPIIKSKEIPMAAQQVFDKVRSAKRK